MPRHVWIPLLIAACVSAGALGVGATLYFADQGPQGEPGATGERGPPGPPGESASEALDRVNDVEGQLQEIDDRVSSIELGAPEDLGLAVDDLAGQLSDLDFRVGQLETAVDALETDVSGLCRGLGVIC